MKCKYLTIIPLETGTPLYKCAVNNAKHNSCFGLIKEKIRDKTVLPNGECPFAYLNIALTDCPCFEE